MPGMPRFDWKAQKIAFELIGRPANLQKQKRTREDKRISQRLTFEETQRVR